MSGRGSSSVANTQPGEQVALNRILPVGALALVLSVIANLVVQAIGVRVANVSPAFMPLASPAPIVMFTAIGVALAVVVFAVVARRASRPFTTYRAVATVALVLSVIPNVLLLFNSANVPGASAGAVVILIVMHVVAYLISVGLLTSQTRAPEAAP